MSQIRDIKARIESVKKTKKITQAMKMVSASKFKRATNKRNMTQTYLNHIRSIYSVFEQESDDSKYAQSNKSNKVAYLILASDRGLCGGFNSAILKYAEQQLKQESNEIDLYLVGAKATQFFNKKKWNIVSSISNPGGHIATKTAREIARPLENDYLTGKYNKIIVIYSQFISAVQNTPSTLQFLPIATHDQNAKKPPLDIIMEPSEGIVIDTVIEEHLNYQLMNALIDAHASEEGARMAAMESATSNAGDMINDLTLLYNRTRQAQITKELSEIVAGAEALVN